LTTCAGQRLARLKVYADTSRHLSSPPHTHGAWGGNQKLVGEHRHPVVHTRHTWERAGHATLSRRAGPRLAGWSKNPSVGDTRYNRFNSKCHLTVRSLRTAGFPKTGPGTAFRTALALRSQAPKPLTESLRPITLMRLAPRDLTLSVTLCG